MVVTAGLAATEEVTIVVAGTLLATAPANTVEIGYAVLLKDDVGPDPKPPTPSTL